MRSRQTFVGSDQGRMSRCFMEPLVKMLGHVTQDRLTFSDLVVALGTLREQEPQQLQHPPAGAGVAVPAEVGSPASVGGVLAGALTWVLNLLGLLWVLQLLGHLIPQGLLEEVRKHKEATALESERKRKEAAGLEAERKRKAAAALILKRQEATSKVKMLFYSVKDLSVADLRDLLNAGADINTKD